MCDYSLMNFPNRLARSREELVLHRFPSGSKGFVSPADLNAACGIQPKRTLWESIKQFFNPVEPCRIPAVCIPPSSRLQFHHIDPEFQREYQVSAEEEVEFDQLSAAANTYRDAVRFASGRRVSLQRLPLGQEATVLDLGDAAEEAEPFELARRAA